MNSTHTVLLGPETLQICNVSLRLYTGCYRPYGGHNMLEQVTHITCEVVCL
jgi:hypothetical protein